MQNIKETKIIALLGICFVVSVGSALGLLWLIKHREAKTAKLNEAHFNQLENKMRQLELGLDDNREQIAKQKKILANYQVSVNSVVFENPESASLSAGNGSPSATRETASEASRLAAPSYVVPKTNADMREGRNYVRFRWATVPGAAAYRVQAWQFFKNRKVVFVDSEVQGTLVIGNPAHRSPIHWRVFAIDKLGNAGSIRTTKINIIDDSSSNRSLSSIDENHAVQKRRGKRDVPMKPRIITPLVQ